MDGTRAGRLLLVEDEHLLRCLVAQFLHTEGFEVLEAADGREALAVYSRLGPFDVVLLDLNLPYVKGVDVCRQIKGRQPAQAFIICSATLLDGHLFELCSLNVDQFLSKPYHPQDLLSRIRGEIERCGSSDPCPPCLPTNAWRVDASDSGCRSPHTLVKVPPLN
jgi:DNA-binding response OmpR family regulator